MGSSSTSVPDSPALRVASLMHCLDVTLGTMPDPAHRDGLLRCVADWLRHHQRSKSGVGPVEAPASHLEATRTHDRTRGLP